MEESAKLIPLDLQNLDHLNVMYTVRTHPDVDQYLCNSPPENFDSHVHYLEQVIKGGSKRFFIICFQESLCGYCHVTMQETLLELGWALHPNWWSKGIGKRSVFLLVQLLQTSGLAEGKTLTLIVKKENARALSIYKKSGFSIVNENEKQEYLMQYQNLPLETFSTKL